MPRSTAATRPAAFDRRPATRPDRPGASSGPASTQGGPIRVKQPRRRRRGELCRPHSRSSRLAERCCSQNDDIAEMAGVASHSVSHHSAAGLTPGLLPVTKSIIHAGKLALRAQSASSRSTTTPRRSVSSEPQEGSRVPFRSFGFCEAHSSNDLARTECDPHRHRRD